MFSRIDRRTGDNNTIKTKKLRELVFMRRVKKRIRRKNKSGERDQILLLSGNARKIEIVISFEYLSSDLRKTDIIKAKNNSTNAKANKKTPNSLKINIKNISDSGKPNLLKNGEKYSYLAIFETHDPTFGFSFCPVSTQEGKALKSKLVN
jgi:hypothetical protein